MDRKFIEKHLDVLQNIEHEVVCFRQQCPDLCDFNVQLVLEALINQYECELTNERPKRYGLTEDEELLMRHVEAICELRLGRAEAYIEGEDEPFTFPAVPVETMIRCLKQIHKSVKFWSKRNGSRGYLDYVAAFFEFEAHSKGPSRRTHAV